MPKVGVPVSISLLDHRHRIFAGRRRVARAVRQEHAVGLQRHDVLGRGRGRHHRHLAAGSGQQPQDVALDAIVDRDHVEFRFVLAAEALAPDPGRLVPGEALGGGDHRHQVHADQAGPFARLFLERLEIELTVRVVRDHRIGHALDPDQRGKSAGVDAGEPDDAAALEPIIEIAGGAVVRRRGDAPNAGSPRARPASPPC